VSRFFQALAGEWERETFPELECVLQNEREPAVFDCPQSYLCLLTSTRFLEQADLRVLFPYINRFEGDLFYGWVDKDGNVSAHCPRSIHMDDLMVVAWQKWDPDVPEVQ